MPSIRLTQFSHGAGCGCKIAPNVLEEILAGGATGSPFADLLVGNDARDDAAVFDLGDGRAIISTTDFFTPIVDDPSTFGRIAAANALSDVYAMGGNPIVAIAILGWPVDKLPPSVARQVVDGGRETCRQAGIPLAGGHSIDSPEPIFGLAATGIVETKNLLRNDSGRAGNLLLLSKPLGIGILTTAEKKDLLPEAYEGLAAELMTQLNLAGAELGGLKDVDAMTDVTGFGLLGHLLEMCGNDLDAELWQSKVPLAADLEPLIELGCVPGGTYRNWSSYGTNVGQLTEMQKAILADPQTSGGLLIAAAPAAVPLVQHILRKHGSTHSLEPIGMLKQTNGNRERIEVRV